MLLAQGNCSVVKSDFYLSNGEKQFFTKVN